MKPGPTLIRRCEHCLHLMRHEWWMSGNSFGGSLWSDGYATGPMVPSFQPLVRCGYCRAFAWIWDLPVEQENVRDYQLVWQQAWLPESLDREDLWLALRAGLGDTPERERWLRTRLWHAGNHASRKRGRFYLRNLARLQALTEDPLERAEMARQRGAFQEALELLADRQDDLAQAIRQRALAGDDRVFCLEGGSRVVLLASV